MANDADDSRPEGPGLPYDDVGSRRPQGPGLPLVGGTEPADNPIRLTGNTAPSDPFARTADESAVEAPPAGEEISDTALAAGDEGIGENDADAERLNLADVTADDASEMPAADDGQLAQGDDDGATADDDFPATELSDGPMMVEPEADGRLPLLAQRPMDEAPSGEPFPADVQDERFPPREPEPGDEELGPGTKPERCPSPRDLKPINQITHRIAAEPGLFPQECVLSDEPFVPRNFACTVFTWKASALCHKPLYFQQAKLERYGHTFGPVLTPVLATGHFFVSVIALPYKIGMNPPWECMYPLGWYRPGSCAPYTLGPVPISLRGAALQGLVTTGLWFLFP